VIKLDFLQRYRRRSDRGSVIGVYSFFEKILRNINLLKYRKYYWKFRKII
jgi:hypothetical protein